MTATVPLQATQGPRVVPRRAEHRPSGSGRHLDSHDPAGARASGRGGAMTERRLPGLVVSTGVAVGPAHRLRPSRPRRRAAATRPRSPALARVSGRASSWTEPAARRGRPAAEDGDPGGEPAHGRGSQSLHRERRDARRRPCRREAAARRDRAACATRLAALGDPVLVGAGLGRARARPARGAIRALSGAGAAEPPTRPSILVARELGPAEIARSRRRARACIARRSRSRRVGHSHDAIVARSFGVPMVVALGDAIMPRSLRATELVVDGGTGSARAGSR